MLNINKVAQFRPQFTLFQESFPELPFSLERPRAVLQNNVYSESLDYFCNFHQKNRFFFFFCSLHTTFATELIKCLRLQFGENFSTLGSWTTVSENF